MTAALNEWQQTACELELEALIASVLPGRTSLPVDMTFDEFVARLTPDQRAWLRSIALAWS